MCTNPQYIKCQPSPSAQLAGVKSFDFVKVPCGKCEECIKARQNSYMVRAYREVLKEGAAHFITLTYDNDNLPLCQVLQRREETAKGVGYWQNLSSPELISHGRDIFRAIAMPYWNNLAVGEERLALFNFYFGKDGEKRYLKAPSLRLAVSPSLNSADVIKWLKKAREAYFREYGVRLKFKYYIVGEYGHKYQRPHYHGLFIGLSPFQMQFFMSMWTLGSRLDCQYIQAKDHDFERSAYHIAMYIGKYTSKGTFDVKGVIKGHCIKMRSMLSRHFGAELNQQELNYFQAQDIYKYDIYNPQFPNDETKFKVFDEISNRLVYYVGGNPFPLPMSLRRTIFDWKNRSGKGVWSKVYYMYSDYLRSRIEEEVDSEFRQFILGFLQAHQDSTLLDACHEFELLQTLSRDSRSKSSRRSLSAFFSSSCGQF